MPDNPDILDNPNKPKPEKPKKIQREFKGQSFFAGFNQYFSKLTFLALNWSFFDPQIWCDKL